MADKGETAFFVNASKEPVIVRIKGRASFMNSAPLSRFFKEMMKGGTKRFVVDFKECSSMDSTFLGILAGAAIEARKQDPPATVTLGRLDGRNLELIRNVGLHKILEVSVGRERLAFGKANQSLGNADQSESESARMILKAHEDLVEIEDENLSKFQDVISFLRNQVGED